MKENEIKERLCEALAKRNMTAAELSEKTQIPKSSISQYVTGYAIPRANRISLICNALSISEPWLMGYDVQMENNFCVEKSDLDTILFEITPRSLESSPFLYDAIINEIRSMSSDMDKIIPGIADYFLNNLDSTEKAHLLNELIDYIIYNKEENRMNIVILDDSKNTLERKRSMLNLSKEETELVTDFFTLNDTGKRKALDFVSDLISMKKYTE